MTLSTLWYVEGFEFTELTLVQETDKVWVYASDWQGEQRLFRLDVWCQKQIADPKFIWLHYTDGLIYCNKTQMLKDLLIKATSIVERCKTALAEESGV